MTSQTPDMQAVLERLEKLERQNRWARYAGVPLLLIFLTVTGCQLSQNRTLEEVRARSFVLVDRQGTERATLGTVPSGAVGLLLSRNNGKGAVEIGVEDQPYMVFYDTHDDNRLEIRLEPDNSPSLALFSALRRNGVKMTVSEEGKVIWRAP